MDNQQQSEEVEDGEIPDPGPYPHSASTIEAEAESEVATLKKKRFGLLGEWNMSSYSHFHLVQQQRS
jgi:hypothetical protein